MLRWLRQAADQLLSSLFTVPEIEKREGKKCPLEQAA